MSKPLEKIELSLDIIAMHFGDNTAKVARFIVEKGPCTMFAIHNSGVSTVDICKTSLGILFQHNLVLLTQQTDCETTVELSLPRTFLRLCAPLFVQHAKNTFGDQGEILTTVFWEHGRLSVAALSALLSARFPTESFEDTFKRMCDDGYLTICQGTGGAAAPAVQANAVTDPEAALEATAPPPTLPPSKKAKTSSSGTKAQGGGGAATSPTTLYRISILQFLFALRSGAVLEYCRNKLTHMEVAWKIVEVILNNDDECRTKFAETMESLPTFSTSTPAVTIDTLGKKMPKVSTQLITGNANALTMEQVGSILTSSTSNGAPNFKVNMGRVLDDIKTRTLESVLLNRYETAGLRIYRLLLRGMLEEKAICDFAMLPPNVVREKLYALQEAGFVCTQQIPKGGALERNYKEMFFVWGVSKTAHVGVLKCAYKALNNLVSRLRSAVEAEGSRASINLMLPLLAKERLAKALLDLASMILVLEFY